MPLLPLLLVLTLLGSLPGQSGPVLLGTPKPATVLAPTPTGKVPLSQIHQISGQRLPGDAQGTFTVCLSGPGLASSLGGKGGDDVLIGRYEPAQGRFTPNNQAAALNSSSGDFGLMLDPTGLVAVLDREDGVYLSRRSKVGTAFPAPKRVQGLDKAWVDPAVGTVSGKLKLFWTQGRGVLMADLDPSTPRISSKPLAVLRTAKAGIVANSATPVLGRDGDVEGFWLAELTPGGQDNDMAFDADMDPATPPIRLVDSPGWMHNGGVLDGRLLYAQQGLLHEIPVLWLVGDDEAIGQVADLRVAMPLPKGESSTIVLFASAGVIKPVPVPGMIGTIALNFVAFVQSGVTSLSDKVGSNGIGIPLPKDSTLQGLSFALQALSIEKQSKRWALSNTSSIKIR